MKIFFLTSGRRVPSSRFRVLQYVPHLRRLGHTCVVAASHPPKYEHYAWLGWRPSQQLQRLLRRFDRWRMKLGRFDVLFLERELFHDETANMERRFRDSCRTMVLDVDDAIFLHAPQKFETLVRMSDAVIAGNRLLAEKVRPLNEQVTVIPTCVDVERFRPVPPSSPTTARADERPISIGWTGTSGNLENLRLIRDPLDELARGRRVELRIIADERADVASLGFRKIAVRLVPWRERAEVADLARFDIGLMPLPDSEWNRYKCGLKLIQYMALGLPAVTSPVGVNAEIVRDGENGYVADSHQRWLEVLGRLIESAELRRQVGLAGRKTVEQRYSIQQHVTGLVRVLQEAIARSRG